jgi:hypothetical protein
VAAGGPLAAGAHTPPAAPAAPHTNPVIQHFQRLSETAKTCPGPLPGHNPSNTIAELLAEAAHQRRTGTVGKWPNLLSPLDVAFLGVAADVCYNAQASMQRRTVMWNGLHQCLCTDTWPVGVTNCVHALVAQAGSVRQSN